MDGRTDWWTDWLTDGQIVKNIIKMKFYNEGGTIIISNEQNVILAPQIATLGETSEKFLSTFLRCLKYPIVYLGS